MPDPSRTLLDLRLPPEIKNLLLPPLECVGLTVEEMELRDPLIYGQMRQAMRLTKGGKLLKLDHLCIFIPAWLLGDETPARLDALNSLAFCFPKGCFVHVCTLTNRYPAVVFRRILHQRWPQIIQGQVNWVPKKYAEEVVATQEPDLQVLVLQDVLDLKAEDLVLQERRNITV